MYIILFHIPKAPDGSPTSSEAPGCFTAVKMEPKSPAKKVAEQVGQVAGAASTANTSGHVALYFIYTRFWTNKPKATCPAHAEGVDTSSQQTIPGVAWLGLSHFHEIILYTCTCIYVVGHGTPMKHLCGTSCFNLRIFSHVQSGHLLCFHLQLRLQFHLHLHPLRRRSQGCARQSTWTIFLHAWEKT